MDCPAWQSSCYSIALPPPLCLQSLFSISQQGCASPFTVSRLSSLNPLLPTVAALAPPESLTPQGGMPQFCSAPFLLILNFR